MLINSKSITIIKITTINKKIKPKKQQKTTKIITKLIIRIRLKLRLTINILQLIIIFYEITI
jgi:hypothetical protein